MYIDLMEIKDKLGEKSVIIKDGGFNSLSLLNGALKKNNILLSYIEDEKYIHQLLGNKDISCIICKDEILSKIKKQFKGGVISSKNPRTEFFAIHNYLNRNTEFYNKFYETTIDASAQIDSTVQIAKNNVTIGKNTRVMSNVVIHENIVIGDNVTIREGTIIGGPAFYYYSKDGENVLVDSTGGVIIENNVEIHANTIISKGVLGNNTIIGFGSKIDSNSSIAHDVRIGNNCIITAGVHIAGSVIINNNCFIGIGTNIVPMIKVGENCKISAGAVVTKDVPDNTHVSGNFAIEHNQFIEFIKGLTSDLSLWKL